jgi:hypothetical protein
MQIRTDAKRFANVALKSGFESSGLSTALLGFPFLSLQPLDF